MGKSLINIKFTRYISDIRVIHHSVPIVPWMVTPVF